MAWIERLLPEQKPAVEFIATRPGTLLLGDTGVGKTYITLAAIERLAREAGRVPFRVLLVVPLTSLDVVWTPKLITFEDSDEELTQFWVVRDPEELPRRRKNAPASSQERPERLLLILHMQAFSKYSRRLAKKEWDFVIIDESQVLKARGSGFSRAARRVRNAKRRLALSATPLDRSPIDLFGQMRFVDHTILGEDFTPFADRYTKPGGWKGKKKIFRASKMGRFLQELAPAMFRLTKDFLNLPPMTITHVPVQLLGKQARLYEQMNVHSVTHEPAITARLAVTKQVKLEQITGGLVIDDTETPVLVGHAKERKLKTLLKRVTDRPIVVFCKYLHEIPMIISVLTGRVSWLHGAIKGEARTAVINDFQAGRIDALVCQVRTGGVSIELTRSCTMIFYSFGFSLIDFEQILGRFHRGGQTKPVNIYIIHAVNTVDDEIIEAIGEKYVVFNEITSVDSNRPSR